MFTNVFFKIIICITYFVFCSVSSKLLLESEYENILFILYAFILPVSYDESGDGELFVAVDIVNKIILQEKETKLFITANKLTTKDERVREIFIINIFICYYLVMFATVFLRITCCITYTTLPFCILMFTNVFLIITICTTYLIYTCVLQTLLLLFTTLQFTVLVSLDAKNGPTLLTGDLLSNKYNIIYYFLQLVVLFISLVFFFFFF